MTSLDEPLRAAITALRDGYRDGSFSDLPGINNAAIAAKLFADELTELLTTRQEVAPVAWEYTYYDDGIDPGSSIRQVDLSPCRFLESWQASKRECVERPLIYGDTGQTSDARDGARLDWIAANRVAVYPELDGPWYADVYRDGEEGEVTASHYAATPREAIDAAMRQEAE